MMRLKHLLIFAALAFAPQAHAGAKLIPGTNCPPFPANSWWQADISKLPVHAKSAAWMRSMDSSRNIWPDFGPSFGAIAGPYGMPYSVVKSPHAYVPIKFFYAAESDRGPYPFGADSKVEGWNWTANTDKHVIVIHADTCKLYETWDTRKPSTGWTAGSGAIWSLKSNKLRPINWTSADAAGLPIFPGLLRYDEVAALNIAHAIRFTTTVTDRTFSWPARHQSGGVSDVNYPPMGARFRIKASYAISPKLRADTRAVLKAMKTYGIVLADNGAPWFFQGTADTRWNLSMLNELKAIPASAFEAVDTRALMISPNSMQVRPQ